MALLLSPVLLGLVLWLIPSVLVVIVLGVTRALDRRRGGGSPLAERRPERVVMRSGIPAP